MASSSSDSLHQKDSSRGAVMDLKSLLFKASSEWFEHLKEEFPKDYFIDLDTKLNEDLENDKIIYPPKDLVFNAFRLTPLNEVKVVILGQDPYSRPGLAHGLSFSVPEGETIPPSLRNVFKELQRDIVGFQQPKDGCLESWAQQGVLLLNSTLTVEAKNQNAHQDYGWQNFTDKVISLINDNRDFVVFHLWGNVAQKKEGLIAEKHCVLKVGHPSPLNRNRDFVGSGVFSITNAELKNHRLCPINW